MQLKSFWSMPPFDFYDPPVAHLEVEGAHRPCHPARVGPVDPIRPGCKATTKPRVIHSLFHTLLNAIIEKQK